MLRVRPFRGDQVAAGAVLLAVLVILLNLRMTGWATGVHLAYTAAVAAWLGALGFLAPRDGAVRPYVTALLVSAWALAAVALVRLADVTGLGADAARTLVPAALAAAGVAIAVRGPATGTLLAAVAGGGAALGAARWLADPSLQADRWILLALVAVYLFGVLARRDGAPAHAVQLANAAALGVLAIAATIAAGDLARLLTLDGLPRAPAGAPWGWTLLVLAAGCGAIAYGAVERARGPVVLGVADLGGFVLLAARGDLAGWPVVLAVPAVAMLVIGLRPSTPLPPEPPRPGEPADVVDLPRP